MTRLETLSPEIATAFRRASFTKQHAACVAACELAVTRTKIKHPLIDVAMQQLRNEQGWTSQQKSELDTLTAQLDDEYHKLQEAAEAGKASTGGYLVAFAKARTAAALSFAGDNAPHAMAEAIYEAAAAVGDDKSEFYFLVESALK